MVACKRKLKQGTNTFDLFFRPKHRVVSKKKPSENSCSNAAQARRQYTEQSHSLSNLLQRERRYIRDQRLLGESRKTADL